MSETRYSKDHEWIRPARKGDDIYSVGITDYAQKHLGDVVFVELPSIGTALQHGDEVGVVESVKAASEVYTPVNGIVTAINEHLEDDPAMVNTHAESRAWFFRLEATNPEQFEELMDKAAYNSYIKSLDD